MRTIVGGVIAAVGLALVLAGCSPSDGAKKDTAEPANAAATVGAPNAATTVAGTPASPVPAAAPAQQARCYEQVDGIWQANSGLSDESRCFWWDSCSGGEGNGQGRCAKWAVAADAPGLAWSALGDLPSIIKDVKPPLRDGLYTAEDACPGEGCSLGRLLVTGSSDLLARPEPDAPVVGTVAKGAWVTATDSVAFVAPQRGVILSTQRGFVRGETIYALDSEGEGFVQIWHNGKLEGGFDTTDRTLVRWDAWQASTHPRARWWIEIEVRPGVKGWVDPDVLACKNSLDPEPECAARP
jgi:hypothetical protein